VAWIRSKNSISFHIPA